MAQRGLIVLAAAAVLLGVGAGTAVLHGSMQRLSSALGARSAVQSRIALSGWWGRLQRKETLLLAGDSRIEGLGGAVLAGAGWHEVNTGIGGTSAADWRVFLGSPGPHPRYDAALFWAGINDFLHHDAGAQDVASHVLAVTRELKQYADRVVVLDQIPVRVGPKARAERLSQRVAELNTRLYELLAHEPNVTLLRVHDALRASDGLLEPWCTDDGLHLNDAGDAWLRRRIEAQWP